MKNELYKKFEILRSNLPAIGTVIPSFEGQEINLNIDKGKVFCNAVVKITDDDCSWQVINEQTGLKCLILPNAQRKLEEKFGDIKKATVKNLLVVGYNKKKTALLCEESNG